MNIKKLTFLKSYNYFVNKQYNIRDLHKHFLIFIIKVKGDPASSLSVYPVVVELRTVPREMEPFATI